MLNRLLAGLLLCPALALAQGSSKPPRVRPDSALSWFTAQYQQTVVFQYHPAFNAPYTGLRSLSPEREQATSLTGTVFLKAVLGRGWQLRIDPEVAGGTGFSSAQGVAGFPNGETFRIGSPAPQVYFARVVLEWEHRFGQTTLKLHGGRFSLADFFDNCSASHDPRSSFLNWALMSNGAWDYPANTRGYTQAAVFELERGPWTLRGGLAQVPLNANGAVMDDDLTQARGQVLELERRWSAGKLGPGTARVLAFYNLARMGNFDETLEIYNRIGTDGPPDITSTRKPGRSKYGFGLSVEQKLGPHLTAFSRLGYNDGANETWAFTQIDRTASLGAVLSGSAYKRGKDQLGLAFVANGISAPHRRYLARGGTGFIVGDGALDYAPELIAELDYRLGFYQEHFFLTPHYQFITNPSYNRARGPVHVLGARFHVEF